MTRSEDSHEGAAGAEREAPPPPADGPPAAGLAPLHSASVLRSLFLRPLRALTVVLSEQDRLARTISQGDQAGLLALGLLYTTLLFSLPFGGVIETERCWRIALLLVGSLGICLPSLQVFGAFVGCRISALQSLALGLVITSVAALFTFGFFPILWFLDATMQVEPVVKTPLREAPARVTASDLALVLLGCSLLAGIVHGIRCLRRFQGLVAAYPLVMILWQALFVFITYRMARLLELLPCSAP